MPQKIQTHTRAQAEEVAEMAKALDFKKVRFPAVIGRLGKVDGIIPFRALIKETVAILQRKSNVHLWPMYCDLFDFLNDELIRISKL